MLAELRSGHAAGTHSLNRGLALGTPLPHLHLKGANGFAFRTEQVYGHGAVLLFIRHTCPACQSMVTWIGDSVQALRAREPQIEVVVFSDGQSPMQLTNSMVVLDDGRQVKEAFRVLRVRRTPWAYRIDAEGRVVASAVPTRMRGLDELFDQPARS